MGNVAALMCAPSSSSSSSSSSFSTISSNNEVKVVSSDGRLVVYTRSAPIKAAEIMLENPGQFLCESTYLKVGQRIPGVCAEEQLERGQLYFLLPMEMLYSVLTNQELNSLSHKTSKGINFSKILPEFCFFPSGSDDEEDFQAIGIGTSDSLQQVDIRYSRQRSWQPALETILETPPHT